jgi:hypothetical protein
LSPDGRWLAYSADATGVREIYVADDVAPDGQHFVMIRDVTAGAREVVYVENWFPELLAKMRR